MSVVKKSPVNFHILLKRNPQTQQHRGGQYLIVHVCTGGNSRRRREMAGAQTVAPKTSCFSVLNKPDLNIPSVEVGLNTCLLYTSDAADE